MKFVPAGMATHTVHVVVEVEVAARACCLDDMVSSALATPLATGTAPGKRKKMEGESCQLESLNLELDLHEAV